MERRGWSAILTDIESVSVVCFCLCLKDLLKSLSTTVPKDLLSLFDSVADYRLFLLQSSQIFCQCLLLLCHVKASRQRLFFCVFVVGKFDRQ